MTKHQKRILAALVELERRFSISWWSRDAIGQVVGAGGFHAVIQKRTMLKLSELSLVLLQVESWPKETRRLVRCNCAAYRWGLSDAGRQIAATIAIRWPDDAEKRFARIPFECGYVDSVEGRTTRGDRFKSSHVFEDSDDDDDDPADFRKRE